MSDKHQRHSSPPDTVVSPDPQSLARVLRVIDCLTVELVRLEPRRLVAEYTAQIGKTSETVELAFRYEEDVFQPHDEVDWNLGSMIISQVALNYGLFCRAIVFRGLYDNADRRFLADMAENTAREIYVKKFLEPNPFLVGEAAHLPALKLLSYCLAELRFEDSDRLGSVNGSGGPRPACWSRGDERYLVLSSGGKDSLLAFGLLREIGTDVHPVFVNESGKHWFTALNAYRHFRANVANTGRVWTNADRLFSWMLRRFPFVRRDFADIRSDDYPIRLWTVAVFLFGALPTARSRGLAHIIIGNEYDCTDRRTYDGITHYNGLYDQSRYFDVALTRYYTAKGWGIDQFSILRPLSELLIEETLAERYPDLLRVQTSCHATHTEGDRVWPCGKCEKCRRIVGMLVALGRDPALCRYREEQVERCLSELARRGAHQEREGVEHLGHLLRGRGLVQATGLGGVPAHSRPQIMKLRFDREHSPVNAVPVSLRARLYPILLGHAHGAAQKRGRCWVDFDPMAPAALAQAYPFGKTAAAAEPESITPGAAEADRNGRFDFVLGEMTWPEADARFKRVDVALLPVGAIEQHGPHLPLDTDAFDAQHLAIEVARRCTEPRPFVLPLIPYGVSYHHEDFRGTISVTNESLSRFVYEVGISVARHGITKMIIVNGHGGNAATLHFAAQMINRDAHIFTCVDSGETSDMDIEQMIETAGDVHAGEIETSTSLATRPHLVDIRKARKSVPKFSSRYLDFSSKRSVDWYARTSKISRSGVMGDPSRASREKGERIWDVMIKNLVEFVEHLKRMSLDEIHERNRF